MTTASNSNSTHLYGKYIKHSIDRFNNEKELFVVLKDKGFSHQKSIYEFNDNTFINLKSKLFNGIKLEPNKVYALAVGKMGNYMNHDYISNLIIQVVSEGKEKTLLKKYDKEIIETMITTSNNLCSESESEDEEVIDTVVIQEKPKIKTKTKRAKRKLKE